MEDVAADLKFPRVQTHTRYRAITVATWSFAVWVVVVLVFLAAKNVQESQHELRLIPWLPYDQRVDFAYFYAAATMVRQGDAANVYPKKNEYVFYPYDPVFSMIEDESVKARLLTRGNYYNPPIVAIAQAPLALLEFRNAYWVFSLVSLGALGALLGLTWRAGRRIPELPLLILGIAAFQPVHEAVIMGHLALILAFSLGAGFLALRAGRPALAGLAFSLLAIKPQWAVLPALLLLVRWEWKAMLVMGIAAAAIFFVPFVVTGPGAFEDYMAFLRHANSDDLKSAPHMFSWNGFLSKQDPVDLFREPEGGINMTLFFVLEVLTLALLVVVWRGGDFYLSVSATVVAMLLLSTRSVWYDWALIVVPAIFLILRPSSQAVRAQVWVILIVLAITAAQSMSALFAPDGRHGNQHWVEPAFFSVTLAAFGALVWMATLTVWERRGALLARPRLTLGRPAAIAATPD